MRGSAKSWENWLKHYGVKRFYGAFLKYAQGAEGTCKYCHRPIYLDIEEGGGIPDWETGDGDYGCEKSPDTTDEGTGGHFPVKKKKKGRR